MDGLLESIASIETIKTGSELSALLLESQLISRNQPRYNTVMRAAGADPFLPYLHLRQLAEDHVVEIAPRRRRALLRTVQKSAWGQERN